MPSGNLIFGMLAIEMKKKQKETQLRQFSIPSPFHIPSETDSIQAFIGKPEETVGLNKCLCLTCISTTTIWLI